MVCIDRGMILTLIYSISAAAAAARSQMTRSPPPNAGTGGDGRNLSAEEYDNRPRSYSAGAAGPMYNNWKLKKALTRQVGQIFYGNFTLIQKWMYIVHYKRISNTMASQLFEGLD
jgi:hypothetical protein